MPARVESEYLGSRVSGFRVGTLAGAVVPESGADDYGTITTPGPGRLTIPVSSLDLTVSPVVVSSCTASAGGAGRTHLPAVPNLATVEVAGSDGGTAADCILHGLLFGRDNSVTSALETSKSVWRSTQTATRLERFKVLAAGGLDCGRFRGTAVRNAVGDYTLRLGQQYNFERSSLAYQATPIVVASAVSAVGATAKIGAVTVDSVQLLVSMGNVPTDAPVYVAVYGRDIQPDTYRRFDPLRSYQTSPRILAGRVTYAATVPTVVVGAAVLTATRAAAGETVVTLPRPFEREPVVLVTGHGGRCSVKADASSSSFIVSTLTDAGVPQDMGFDVVVIGDDDALEV